jgi:antitoxin component YwqK of YwqJK toxin-antitoxin module
MTEFIEEYFTKEEVLKKIYYNHFYDYADADDKLIKFKGFINNGKKEGKWIIGYIKKYCNIFKNFDYGYFYDEVNYIDDKLNGPYIKYNQDEKIMEEGNYKDNMKNGIITHIDYYFNYIDKRIFENGIENGDYICYNINTNFIIEYGNFKYEKVDGKFKIYDKNGNIISIYYYINGKQEGKIVNYDKNGNILQIYYYINGKQ